MFKNRAAQIQFVRTPKSAAQTGSPESHVEFDFNKINTILKEQTLNVAKATVAAAVILKVTNAACTIAINASPKK